MCDATVEHSLIKAFAYISKTGCLPKNHLKQAPKLTSNSCFSASSNFKVNEEIVRVMPIEIVLLQAATKKSCLASVKRFISHMIRVVHLETDPS
jgi:hypothetical protein